VPELDGATLVTWVRTVLRRDLGTLRRELDLYTDDQADESHDYYHRLRRQANRYKAAGDTVAAAVPC